MQASVRRARAWGARGRRCGFGLRAVATGLAAWLLGIALCLTVGSRVYVWIGTASWS